MRKYTAAILAALATTPAIAQGSRYVTFKTVRDEFGKTEHQINRDTIRQEGPYRIFWSRIWKDKQPVAISSGGQLYIWSQKFAVDCAQRRFAPRFIDSTAPRETKKQMDMKTMRWNSVKQSTTIVRTVCGER